MANVLLQFGQSGSRIGASLLSSLSRDAANDIDDNYWFHEADKEELVANSLLMSTGPIHSSRTLDSVVYSNSSTGGNSWAAGYSTVGPTLLDTVVDGIYRICERLDNVSGFLAVGGIGKGVDSGVETYISQHLKDYFPRKIVSNFVVIPNSHERTSMQNYDSVFSLAKIHKSSDAIILSPESNSFGKTLKCQNSGFDAVTMAEQLTNVLQCDLAQNMLKRFPLLALHHDLKLLNLQSSPNHIADTANSNSFTWKSIVSRINGALNSAFKPMDRHSKLCGNTKFHKNADGTNKCVSLLFSVRDNTKVNVLPLIETKFNQCSIYPDWTIPLCRFQIFQRDGPFLSRNKMCTVLANNTFYNCWLDDLIEESWKQYNLKAYLHHFLSNYVTDADFVETFLMAEQILDSYKSLNHF